MAHCKVTGHSTVRCAKTAEPIDMPFFVEDSCWPTEPCIRWWCRSRKGKGEGEFFVGCPAIQKHWQSSLQRSLSLSRSL